MPRAVFLTASLRHKNPAVHIKSRSPGAIRTGLSRNFRGLIPSPGQTTNQGAAGSGNCNGFRGGILKLTVEVRVVSMRVDGSVLSANGRPCAIAALAAARCALRAGGVALFAITLATALAREVRAETRSERRRAAGTVSIPAAALGHADRRSAAGAQFVFRQHYSNHDAEHLDYRLHRHADAVQRF